MQLVEDPEEMQAVGLRLTQGGASSVLVPTMGALHPGHLFLIQKARQEGAPVIVSVYVNPLQFGPGEDLAAYPRTTKADVQACEAAGVDLLFAPRTLYADDHSTYVGEEVLSSGRCGRSRPGHFRGVATVVVKLLNLTQAAAAVFGWKDAQQLSVIRRVVRDLALPVRIVPVEIQRDRDGLAWSSRNRYLSTEQRNRAAAFPRILEEAARRPDGCVWAAVELNKRPGFRVDYVEEVDGRVCGAIWIDEVRLIDNFPCAS
ncbi:pantoate--beta-alanine ligase [Methylacidimicrobium tartarophylax]|uniref:Pantothenate synthetase n=1 Tax=Methylacidimicrobium tartarophylax TaxID=1041768 RepID=A0A5E6MPT8_9BACT|nr:pantoate--beta-alanine ligase [Methylacidimicrobium tartarophylax]VVM08059.1 pantoate--beta-alanine ligase [Methylacidimicrobium tartarophylax]